MKIRAQAERGSGIGLKLFGFIAESVFTFIPEYCSRSPRHGVRNHPGLAVTFLRIPHHALVEATVQRSRPVVLTALAAVLAFIPLTFSVFWGSMAFTLIGGTAVGTVLTLIFLPALYSIWFGVKPTAVPSDEAQAELVRA